MSAKEGEPEEAQRRPDDEDEAAAEDDSAAGGKKHHDDGAADLEKVTDFAEDKDDLNISKEAFNTVLTKQDGGDATKTTIKREDVDLIMRELLVSKAVAERKLREHRGNTKAAMKAILGF